MINFKKLSLFALASTILTVGACFASSNPPANEDKAAAEKIGREAARLDAQAKGAASDVKQGFKKGKKDFKDKYKHAKK